MEKSAREKDLEDAVWRVSQGDAPNTDAVKEFARSERRRLQQIEAKTAREGELSESQALSPVDHKKSTAEPRPTAYLPEEFSLPKFVRIQSIKIRSLISHRLSLLLTGLTADTLHSNRRSSEHPCDIYAHPIRSPLKCDVNAIFFGLGMIIMTRHVFVIAILIQIILSKTTLTVTRLCMLNTIELES